MKSTIAALILLTATSASAEIGSMELWATSNRDVVAYMDYSDDSCMNLVRHGPAKVKLSVEGCDVRTRAFDGGIVIEVRGQNTAFVERDVGAAVSSVYEIEAREAFTIVVTASTLSVHRADDWFI